MGSKYIFSSIIFTLALCVLTGCGSSIMSADRAEHSQDIEGSLDEMDWKCTRIDYYNAEGGFVQANVHNYDKNGFLNELQIYVPTEEEGRLELFIHYTMENDSKGNWIKDSTLSVEQETLGEVKEYNEYTRDEYGNTLTCVSKVADGSVYRITYFDHELDDAGRILKETPYYKTPDQSREEKGAEGITTSYEYDDKGRIVREYSNSNLNSEKEYDAAGRLAKTISYSLGEVYSITTYQYDEYGNNIRSEDYEPDGTTLTGYAVLSYRSN